MSQTLSLSHSLALTLSRSPPLSLSRSPALPLSRSLALSLPRSCLREFPRPAILATQKPICLSVTNHLFLRAVPMEAASELERDHSEQGDVCRIVNIFDVADWLAAILDSVEEVGPKFLDVLVVGLIQFCVFVDHLVCRSCGIESPSIEPAHMKRPVRAIKIAAYGLLGMRLFGVVSRKTAVLPTDGELFEFVNGHLMIGRVGRLSFFGVHDG